MGNKQNCSFISPLTWLMTDVASLVSCFPSFYHSSSSLLQAFTPHLHHHFIRAISGPHLFNASLFWPLPRLASPRLRWSVCQWSARGRHLLRVSCPPPRGLPGLLRHDYRRRRLDGESVEDAHKHKLWESAKLWSFVFNHRMAGLAWIWCETLSTTELTIAFVITIDYCFWEKEKRLSVKNIPRIVPTDAWDHLRVTSEALLSLPNNTNMPKRMHEKPERSK